MKDSHQNEIKILSKRALLFLEAPEHVAKCTSEQGGFWNFSKEKAGGHRFLSDKILTLSYQISYASNPEILIIEAFSRMCLGRNIEFVNKLSFRELENFLRDENHLPVFENQDLNDMENIYQFLKISLLSSFLLDGLKSPNGENYSTKVWSELTYIEKNREISCLVALLNSLIPEKNGLQLALAEADEIFIVMNDFPLKIEIVGDLIHRLFLNSEAKYPLKVVAVQ